MAATVPNVPQADDMAPCLKAARESGLTPYQIRRNAMLGRIRTHVPPGSPVRFSLTDARRVAAEVNAARPSA